MSKEHGNYPVFSTILDDQCRRAFGDTFDYCRDLSYGVNISLLLINIVDQLFSSSSQNVLVYIVEKFTQIQLHVLQIMLIGLMELYVPILDLTYE